MTSSTIQNADAPDHAVVAGMEGQVVVDDVAGAIHSARVPRLYR